MSLLSLVTISGLAAVTTAVGGSLLLDSPATAPPPHVVQQVPAVSAAALPAPPAPARRRVHQPAPRGDAVWPLRPRPKVERGFDPPEVRWGSGHRGVDLAGQAGAAVHTAKAGTVTFAGRLAGRGVVVISHGTTRTTYEPVDPTVSVGDQVETGAVIGTLQRGGSHCFPAVCLHWGLIRGDIYLDPLTLVDGGPVRLLPLSRSGLRLAGAPGGRPSATAR